MKSVIITGATRGSALRLPVFMPIKDIVLC